jgi:hypothetical protein
VPANPPPAAAKNKDTFPDWVEYLVKFVGDSLEKLNGLQFDMTRNNADTKKRQIVTELSNLAAVLDIGRGNNPKELRWPLAGSYICNLDSNRTGFTEFTVALYFENEPDYRLVVNCSVEIVATGRTQSVGARSLGARSVAAPDSSSSSYVRDQFQVVAIYSDSDPEWPVSTRRAAGERFWQERSDGGVSS